MAQTVIKVPGMLEANEYGTPLAKASDIYDNTQSKLQSAINAELYQKVKDIDATPTYGSGKAVSSNGVYSELADLGRDINLLSSVGGTEVIDSGSRLTPAAYKAGDIFYVEEGNEGSNFSQFVYGVKYYVAKADGNSGADLDSNLFDNTYSGAEALRFSTKYKKLVVDQNPTEDSENPVSSGGMYNAMSRMGGNLSDMIEVSGIAVNYQTMRVNAPFDAGDIFYINAPSGTTSEFVDAKIYYVAKKDGPSGTLLTNAEYFTSTTSGAEAVRLSASHIYAANSSYVSYDTEQSLTSAQQRRAQTNIGIDYSALLERISELERKVAYYHPESVAITVSPRTAYVGHSSQIKIVVSTTLTASSIKLYRGNVEIRSVENSTGFTYNDTPTPSATGTIVYRVEAQISGETKSAEASVTVEAAPASDYYVGWTNGSKAQFAAKTNAEMISGATDYSSVIYPNYTRAFGNNNIFYLMYQSSKTPKKVIFTSQGINMEQDIVNDNTCPHSDVTIGGVTYKVFGIRLTSGHDPADTMTVNF